MPKIKTPSISLDPRTPAISIADPSPRQGRVTRATPQRVFDSGKGILADVLSDVGGAVQSFAKYQAKKDAEMLKTESSDYLADLANYLNGRYINAIATKRSGSAKDIFKDEVALTQEGKEVFLERAGDNKRLRDMLSIGYDAVTQLYLHKVSQHKLIQDEVYIRDTARKVAKTLQAEMTNLKIDESGKAVTISEQIHSQLKDYPVTRELMKRNAWKEFYKFNARVDPDLTQEVYLSPEARKSIINQIGSAGYDSIQEAIDIGRKIKLQNEQLTKIRAAEKKEKDVETVMGGAINLYLDDPGKFDAGFVRSLKLSSGEELPSKEKRILIGFFNSIVSGKILTDAEVDYSIYAELLEDVRRGKTSGLKIVEVQSDIIKHMNRSITNTQGAALLKALSNRDILDQPTIQASFDKIENMYKVEEAFSGIEYINLVQGLFDTVFRYDGNPKKVQEYMQDIVEPAARRSWWRKWRSKDPTEFELQEDIRPYMSDREEEAIVTLLADKNQKTNKGVTITIDMIDDNLMTRYLEFVRSNEYLKKQNIKVKLKKTKLKAKAKAKVKVEELPILTQ